MIALNFQDLILFFWQVTQGIFATITTDSFKTDVLTFKNQVLLCLASYLSHYITIALLTAYINSVRQFFLKQFSLYYQYHAYSFY